MLWIPSFMACKSEDLYFQLRKGFPSIPTPLAYRHNTTVIAHFPFPPWKLFLPRRLPSASSFWLWQAQSVLSYIQGLLWSERDRSRVVRGVDVKFLRKAILSPPIHVCATHTRKHGVSALARCAIVVKVEYFHARSTHRFSRASAKPRGY